MKTFHFFQGNTAIFAEKCFSVLTNEINEPKVSIMIIVCLSTMKEVKYSARIIMFSAMPYRMIRTSAIFKQISKIRLVYNRHFLKHTVFIFTLRSFKWIWFVKLFLARLVEKRKFVYICRFTRNFACRISNNIICVLCGKWFQSIVMHFIKW